jgi:hypothetical protein
MIYLSLTTDKIQLVTSSAATVDVNCNFVEAVKATGATADIGKQNTAISSATTTDILAVPGASNARTLKQMTVRNKDATLSIDVTVLYNANATTYELHKVTLGTGDSLIYIEGVGFFTLAPAAKLDSFLRMPNDTTHATAATWADLTGLAVALKSGKNYVYEAHLFHINNATTTGSQFGYNIGAAPTIAIVGNHSGVTNAVVTGVISLGTATARDTAITAQTTGSTGITHTIIGGHIQPSADGTFALRGTSEVTVASGMIVKAGSWLHMRETDN